MKKSKRYYYYSTVLPLMNLPLMFFSLWLFGGMRSETLTIKFGLSEAKAQAITQTLFLKLSPILPIKTIGMILAGISILIAVWCMRQLKKECSKLQESSPKII